MNELPEFIVDRVFDAPREMVWRAWTDPEYLHRWYGPGAETTIHEFNLEPDGLWLNEMRWGDKSLFQKVVFKEVIQPEKMVWHHYSCTDSDWNNIPNPMMADWPKVLLTTVLFEEIGYQTNVRLTQIPLEATEAEIACFAETMDSMKNGWGSGYAILDELLIELLSEKG